jgi:hypothetical protein
MKKPKSKKKEILKASDIKNYLRNKFDLECDEFWDWFFEGSTYGDVNVLSMNVNDVFKKSFVKYIKTIKNEFYFSNEDEFDDYSLDIENDL